MHVVTKMFQQTLSLLFVLSCLIFSTLSVSTQDSIIYVQCSQLNFTSNTPYESNVNSLLTSLIDSASLYNFNKFQTSAQDDDIVYGLFQCRGDVTSPNCKDCVANAISQLQTTCPMCTGGQIQLEGCFVKYDNTAFFGAEEKTEVSKRCGPPMGYNSDVSNRIVAALANLVGGNGEYFRDGDYGSIQGVAQCVQDLSLSDCQDCLLEASGRLISECVTSTWGEMYLGKCNIRYADMGNGNLANNGTSSSSKSNGGGGNNTWKWVTAGGTILTALSSAGGLRLYYKNSSKTNTNKNANTNTNTNTNNASITAEFKIIASEFEKKTKKWDEEVGKVNDVVKEVGKVKDVVKEVERKVKDEAKKPQSQYPPHYCPGYWNNQCYYHNN